jgi:hypothetical protein
VRETRDGAVRDAHCSPSKTDNFHKEVVDRRVLEKMEQEEVNYFVNLQKRQNMLRKEKETQVS